MKIKTLIAAVAVSLAPSLAAAGELYVTRAGVTERVAYTEKQVLNDGAACQDMMWLSLAYNDMQNLKHFVGTQRCIITQAGETHKVIDGSQTQNGVVQIYAHKQFFVVPAYVFEQ